jgi:hypothetical protein
VKRDGVPRRAEFQGMTHESPTAALWALPHLSNSRERDRFWLDVKSTLGSPVQDLVHRGGENIARTDSGGSKDRQRRALTAPGEIERMLAVSPFSLMANLLSRNTVRAVLNMWPAGGAR